MFAIVKMRYCLLLAMSKVLLANPIIPLLKIIQVYISPFRHLSERRNEGPGGLENDGKRGDIRKEKEMISEL